MEDETKISGREWQRHAQPRAMSVDQFCQSYGPGRTKAYEELKSGRLRGRKFGKRTIIAADDAEEWLQKLPAVEAKNGC